MNYQRFFKWSTPGFDGVVEGRCCCPCCGYPTLYQWGYSGEICGVCWWENDGTGDKCADEILSGPNSSYSLREARANFEDHGDKYRYGVGRIEIVYNPSPYRLAILLFIRNINPDEPFDMETFEHLMRYDCR